jgi:activator of 2-hydroxyglutaryl-CoA dehydratase
LALKDEQVVFPANSQLFVAIGAAIGSRNNPVISFNNLQKSFLP